MEKEIKKATAEEIKNMTKGQSETDLAFERMRRDAVTNEKTIAENAGLEQRVEEERITLVDNKDDEYEFMILDRLEYEGKKYLALVSCDVKEEKSLGEEPGSGDDITIVEELPGEEISYGAVGDAGILLALSRLLEKRFGHLKG